MHHLLAEEWSKGLGSNPKAHSDRPRGSRMRSVFSSTLTWGWEEEDVVDVHCPVRQQVVEGVTWRLGSTTCDYDLWPEVLHAALRTTASLKNIATCGIMVHVHDRRGYYLCCRINWQTTDKETSWKRPLFGTAQEKLQAAPTQYPIHCV